MMEIELNMNARQIIGLGFALVVAGSFAYGVIAGLCVFAIAASVMGRTQIKRFLDQRHQRALEELRTTRELAASVDAAMTPGLDVQALLAMFRAGLENVLRLQGDAVLFRRADDGQSITASQALAMLERGDPDLHDLLADTIGVAVQTLRIRRSKE